MVHTVQREAVCGTSPSSRTEGTIPLVTQYKSSESGCLRVLLTQTAALCYLGKGQGLWGRRAPRPGLSAPAAGPQLPAEGAAATSRHGERARAGGQALDGAPRARLGLRKPRGRQQGAAGVPPRLCCPVQLSTEPPRLPRAACPPRRAA